MTVYKRMLEDRIREWLQIKPAVMIDGARLVGKTTLAEGLTKSKISLDDPVQRQGLSVDIAGGLSNLEEPILIDEWGWLPEVLVPIKHQVDRVDTHNNRFVLTGSWTPHHSTFTQTAPGRVQPFQLYPMTVSERKGIVTKPLVDRVADGECLEPSSEGTVLREYLNYAVTGGYPGVLGLTEAAAYQYMSSYWNNLILGDVTQVTKRGVREVSFRSYVYAYAAHTLTDSFHSAILDDVNSSYKTGDRYATILRHLFLTEEIQPWSSNTLKRLAKSTRKLMVDSALLTSIMRWSANGLMLNGSFMGKVIETFVISQILAEVSVGKTFAQLFYFKEHGGGREIDLLVEIDNHYLIGIEVKCTSTPSPHDARHLKWFRNQDPDHFLAGLVLHMGKSVIPLGEKIWAVPISTLWSGQQ